MTDMKIVIAGPSGSGKTNLFNHLAQKNEIPKSTIGPVICTREYRYGAKRKNIKIIDTSGDQKFKNMTRSFLKGINGCILVFDLSDEDKFEEVNDWFFELKRGQDVQIVLVGNKKGRKEKINEEKAKAFALQKGIQYFETDYTDKYQIEKILNSLLQIIYTYETNVLKADIKKSLVLHMKHRGLK